MNMRNPFRRRRPRNVTVTLTADTTRFDASMRDTLEWLNRWDHTAARPHPGFRGGSKTPDEWDRVRIYSHPRRSGKTAMLELIEANRGLGESAVRAIGSMNQLVRQWDIVIARLEATYIVRGGLIPNDLRELRAMVRHTLNPDWIATPDVYDLPLEVRARLAAALIHGYTTTHPQCEHPITRRAIGMTEVTLDGSGKVRSVDAIRQFCQACKEWI